MDANNAGAKRVLLISRDRASVQAIAPVAGHLAGVSGITPVALSLSESESTYQKYGIAPTYMPESRFLADRQGFVREILDSIRPHLVLTGSSDPTSDPPETPEQHVIIAARARAIPVVSVLDAWGYYRDRFAIQDGSDPESWVLPDTICALDRLCYDDLRRLGVPASRLEITHNPWVDAIVRAAGERRAARDPSVTQAGFYVLFVSQPLDRSGTRKWPYSQYDLFDILWSALGGLPAEPPRRVIVWIHPKEDPGPWMSRVRSDGNPSIVIGEERGPEVLMHVDCVVTSHSTVVYEALYYDTPCIMLRPGNPALAEHPPDRLGLTTVVSDEAGLRAEILRPPLEGRRRVAAARRSLLQQGLFFSDGRATERVAALVRGYLEV